LSITIGQVDKHRDVLSRRDSRQRTTVGWFQDKGDDVGRLLDTSDDTIGARRLSGIHVRLLIKPRLFRDELECEQPVDLAPRGGDLGLHNAGEGSA
jgi:hypothetical protein